MAKLTYIYCLLWYCFIFLAFPRICLLFPHTPLFFSLLLFFFQWAEYSSTSFHFVRWKCKTNNKTIFTRLHTLFHFTKWIRIFIYSLCSIWRSQRGDNIKGIHNINPSNVLHHQKINAFYDDSRVLRYLPYDIIMNIIFTSLIIQC